MSNLSAKNTKIAFRDWLDAKPDRARGFLSIYNNEPFDYNGSPAFEVGRQLGLVAKLDGLRRGDLLRKVPNRPQYLFVKKQIPQLYRLAVKAGLFNTAPDGTTFARS